MLNYAITLSKGRYGFNSNIKVVPFHNDHDCLQLSNVMFYCVKSKKVKLEKAPLSKLYSTLNSKILPAFMLHVNPKFLHKSASLANVMFGDEKIDV